MRRLQAVDLADAKHCGFREEITHIDPVLITYFKLSRFLFRNIYMKVQHFKLPTHHGA